MGTPSHLDPETQKRVLEWLAPPYDEKTRQAVQTLIDKDPTALNDAFYTTLSFGTGGLRALMGVGTNRLNSYTIQIATQGLANYLLKQPHSSSLRVFIGFDSRHNSSEFAQVAAQVLAGNGIHTLLTKELRPTPYVSFGCRYKKCHAAIMITASHNPAEYNGYKVYWSDGGQIVPPHDTGIIQEVNAIQDMHHVKRSTPSDPLIEIVDEGLDLAYLLAIRPLQLQPDDNKRLGNTLKITYTSLHGTGITLTPKALCDWGFSSLNYVEAQIKPDGDFPTVKFPNPEYKEALQLGIDQLVKTQSDLLLATDPDADRMGAVVLHQKQPIILTGNEIASLCVEYLCESLSKHKAMPSKGAFVTTIVSTDLIKTIADAYDLACFEVLTGFKYIGEKIHLWETSPESYQFLFGAEESYGYLLGTHARDKDATVSACLLSEIALQAKKQGLSLIDKLYEIYRKYGIFREAQRSLNFKPGKEGMDKITSSMHSLRKKPPLSLFGQKVLILEDYERRTRSYLDSNKKEMLDLPESDVLLFRLADKSKVVIRPSGTEPKIKIYAGVSRPSTSSIPEAIASADNYLKALLASVQKDLFP